jgi:voltage-gated potassium channel
MGKNNTPSENNFTALSLIILILSIYVLVTLVITSFFILPTEVSKILTQIDNFICVVFLFDFGYRLYIADNKLAFMKWGWIDLISSIPSFEVFRFGRVFRLIRLFRILRAFKSVKNITAHVYKNKSIGLLATVGLIAFLMVLFSSIAILQFENEPSSNIKTAEDAIWWSYTTLTTVGYGDKYPVTTEGRLIAMLLMTTGVGLCGTFAGYIASFLNSNKDS